MQSTKKHRQYIFVQIIKVILFIISLLSFILSFIYTDNILLIIISIPFILYLLCFVHELGHLVGCKIKKKKIKSFNIFSFRFEDNKYYIDSRLNFGGNCCFIKDDRSSKLIYLLGPFNSLIISFISYLIYYFSNFKVMFIFFILSLITLICTLVPYRGSDIYNLFNNGGLLNGKEN